VVQDASILTRHAPPPGAELLPTQWPFMSVPASSCPEQRRSPARANLAGLQKLPCRATPSTGDGISSSCRANQSSRPPSQRLPSVDLERPATSPRLECAMNPVAPRARHARGRRARRLSLPLQIAWRRLRVDSHRLSQAFLLLSHSTKRFETPHVGDVPNPAGQAGRCRAQPRARANSQRLGTLSSAQGLGARSTPPAPSPREQSRTLHRRRSPARPSSLGPLCGGIHLVGPSQTRVRLGLDRRRIE